MAGYAERQNTIIANMKARIFMPQIYRLTEWLLNIQRL